MPLSVFDAGRGGAERRSRCRPTSEPTVKIQILANSAMLVLNGVVCHTFQSYGSPAEPGNQNC